jgi:hypothetical protein
MAVIVLAAVACRWPRLVPILTVPAAWFVSTKLGISWTKHSWIRLGLVLGALYLPFVVPASLVDCSHCREAWLGLFPVVPGVLPAHLLLRLTDVGRLPDDFEYLLAALLSIATVVALLLLVRRGRLRLAAGVLLGLLWSSFAAVALDAAIRA